MRESGPQADEVGGARAEELPRTVEELRHAVEECEARLTEAADLAAHVRHEINNPLTGIIGQAQLLLREELSERARRRVETIVQLATRIRDTVAELREIQRMKPSAPKAGAVDEEPPRH
jgi:two-component system, NtrC family, sensor kinase